MALRPEEIDSVSVSVYQGALDLLAPIQPTTPYFANSTCLFVWPRR